ncbi:hypothetical protein F3K36_29710 [Delftia sp. BR1]|nr:hypothetical protein F3K36_29710 [Delftia sp. BR1]
MRNRTITLRPGESFVTADGVTVEARTEEQECRDQASLDRIETARAETVAGLIRSAGVTALPRAVSITDLDDRIVIEVGAAELRLTKEEAASLFSIGSVYARKPQA